MEFRALLTVYLTIGLILLIRKCGAACPLSCQCERSVSDYTVDCRGSGLQSLPEDLPPDTTVLLLSDNKLSRLGQTPLSTCKRLRVLDLSGNHLERIDHGTFEAVPGLQEIYLHDNILQMWNYSSLPHGTLDKLTDLEILTVHRNHWTKMFQFRCDLLQNKAKLRVLKLDSPEGAAVFPVQCSNLPSLVTMEVHGGLSVVSQETLQALHRSPLEELWLVGGHLHTVLEDTFTNLTSLRALSLGNNINLGFSASLLTALRSLRDTNIQKLYLPNIVHTFNSTYPVLDSMFFECLQGVNLTELYLDYNGLVSVQGNFHNFSNLVKLSLSHNRLFFSMHDLYNGLSSLTQLTYLDVSHQASYQIAHSAGEKTVITSAGSFFFGPRLSVLNLSLTFAISRETGHMTFNLITNTTHMAILDVSQNQMPRLNQRLVVVPKHDIHIDVLNISTCSIEFISDNVFPSSMKVYSLDLSNNQLHRQIEQNGTFLLQFRQTLRDLDLSQNGIRYILSDVFRNLGSLRRLILRGNSLRQWNQWHTSQDYVVHLRYLGLSYNMLSHLDLNTRLELDQIQNLSLDLTGNPLDCQCYNLNFMKWIKHTKVNVINRNSYTCNEDQTMNITEAIYNMTIRCQATTWVKVTGGSLGVLVLGILLAAVVHHYRWDIRYACLKLVRQRKEDLSRQREDTFDFDVFVAYHHDDLSWVVHEMMPRLEGGSEALSLCVHHRNWLPGPTIEESISHSVEACRKTLLVVSRSFSRSPWCELEMQLARLQGLEQGREIVVVVALEELPLRSMSRTLVNLRRTNTWLDWPQYNEDRRQFWLLLTQALSKPGRDRSRTQSVCAPSMASASSEDSLLSAQH